jgi:hypothetical protein
MGKRMRDNTECGLYLEFGNEPQFRLQWINPDVTTFREGGRFIVGYRNHNVNGSPDSIQVGLQSSFQIGGKCTARDPETGYYMGGKVRVYNTATIDYWKPLTDTAAVKAQYYSTE